MVRQPRLRVSGPRSLLAALAHARLAVLGRDPVSRPARAAAIGPHRQHAMAVFLLGLVDPGFLRRGPARTPGRALYYDGFLALLVVHLWVEDFLELFTTVMVAYMFVLLGVVHERVALAMIYLDILLYSAGGVVGTMHHVYFSGEPSVHMALGAFFSAGEVIPLTFLTLEAWSFLQLGAQQGGRSSTPFPHRWAVMFLVSVGFWNFLGA